jgi:hypothetical protein
MTAPDSNRPPADRVQAADVRAALSERDPRLLAAVLDSSDVAHDGDSEGAPELADKLVSALWWRTHSPVGQLLAQDDLGQLVDRVAAKLGVDVGEGDDWARLAALTDAMVPDRQPLDIDDLPDDAKDRLRRAAWGQVVGWTGVGASVASRLAATRLLGLMAGPVWNLLRWVPKLGPALVSFEGAAGVVSVASGPVGVVLALATLNHALGPRHDRALPLLVGAGLVMRNPLAVVPGGG